MSGRGEPTLCGGVARDGERMPELARTLDVLRSWAREVRFYAPEDCSDKRPAAGHDTPASGCELHEV